jgi:predicted HAD superfamily Cof-like phosphohydrolase
MVPERMRSDMNVNNLRRGDNVVALKHLDPSGANAHINERGVVFQTEGYHEVGSGPMVRWANGGACNVYEGDVAQDLVTPNDLNDFLASSSYFKDVVAFHRAMGHPVAEEPSVQPSPSTDLGWLLVEEEYRETRKGFADRDVVETADGIADTIWVLCGLAARLGINLDSVWEEVRRTNMAKTGGPLRKDGKLLKPEGWTPPDIIKALEDKIP